MCTTRLTRSGALWLLVPLLLSGCPRKKSAPETPEQAMEAVAAAMRADGGARSIYDLLDEGTRFSIMSAHTDLQRICTLVRSHYPKHLQAREVRRCDLASRAKNAKVWFIAYARRHRLLEPLKRVKRSGKGRASSNGERVELGSAEDRLAFCKEEGVWTFCGLKQHFDQLKVKTARDLETVSENVEAYKGGQ